jgi:hypothetical protein
VQHRMTLFAVIYLAVGVAGLLWVVLVPSMRGRMPTVRSGSQLLYFFVPVVGYHAALNDPFVILGLVTIPLSSAWLYFRNGLFAFAAIAFSASLLWTAWSLAVFTHRASEWTYPVVILGGFVIWVGWIFARTKCVAEGRDPNDYT